MRYDEGMSTDDARKIALQVRAKRERRGFESLTLLERAILVEAGL